MRKISIAAFGIAFYLLGIPVEASAAVICVPNEAVVSANGENVEMEAYNIDGYTYFRLRDIAEHMGFLVKWNEEQRQIEISSGGTVENTEKDAALSPWEYQKMLGKGLDVDWSKTNKGMEYYDEKAVKDFVAAGISHVRIRVTENADEELFEHLDRQINDCLANGLIPILAYQGDELKNDPTERNIRQAVKWWEKTAERYQAYPHRLSFDLMIEVTDQLSKEPDTLNRFYEEAAAAIRKTNPDRILMISPRMRSDAAYLTELEIPSAHNGYIMAEWHFYASGPSKTNARKLWTTGTPQEKKLIQDKIDSALAWQESTGIPTWVGAWMPGNYNDGNDYSIQEQVEFARFVTESLDSAGIPFAVNSDTKFYQRETGLWIEGMRPVFQTIFGT